MAQIDDATTLTLAVAGSPPHAAAVFHARAGDQLVFVTDPATLHAERMLGDPAVAFTVQGQPAGWEAIQGIQGRGTATIHHDRDVALAVFARRFPAAARLITPATVLWKLELRWLRLIDNTRGFGFKAEFARDAGGPWRQER